MSEARTTPERLQIPGLIGMGLLAAYFLLCAAVALEKEYPPFIAEHPYSVWLGNWQMFTLLDRRHVMLEGQAKVDGQWEKIDLEALFPTRWESGPRYGRPSFPEDVDRMYVLAQATCRRLAAAGAEPDELRFRQVRWEKVLGQASQPVQDPEGRGLISWRCSEEFVLPAGVRL